MKTRAMIVALVFAALCSWPVSAAPRAETAGVSVYVDSANAGWTTTGIVLEAGQMATIQASGAAFCSIANGRVCLTGPEGAQPAWETFLLPGAPAYGLVISLDGGPPRFVGAGPTKIDGPGEIRLAYNDEIYPDNIGGYAVDIRVSPVPSDGTNATAATGATPSVGTEHAETYAAVVRAPVALDGSSTFPADHGNVPVSFSLHQAAAETCELPPARISVTRVEGTGPVPVPAKTFSSSSDAGEAYRVSKDGCAYEYKLRAAKLGPGLYEVAVAIGGRQVGGAFFTLE